MVKRLGPIRLTAFDRPQAPGNAEDRISPLAGPSIPIPPEQEENFEARYDAWRSVWNGSVPEFIVWEYLTIQHQLDPLRDFHFQDPVFGGRTKHGGFVVDFAFPSRQEAWRVQGLRFHLLFPTDRARDALSKVVLSSRGWKVLDLYEDDLLTRPNFVLDKAWFQSLEVVDRKQF